MLEAVGTDSARRPDQFSAGSPSICARSALVIGELSSNSGQVSDARGVEQLACATVCLGMESLGSFGVWDWAQP